MIVPHLRVDLIKRGFYYVDGCRCLISVCITPNEFLRGMSGISSFGNRISVTEIDIRAIQVGEFRGPVRSDGRTLNKNNALLHRWALCHHPFETLPR